jgi:phosphatidylinositol N-acetylglucosaminyltransferase subunit P
VYIYVALASYNTGFLTLKMESIETVVDDAANIATVDGRGKVRPTQARGGQGTRKKERAKDFMAKNGEKRDWKALWNEGTDAVMDVPLGGVCEVLYGEGRDGSDDDIEDGP